MKNRFGITRFSWLAAMMTLLSFLMFAGEARANYLFYNADTGREVFSNAVEAPSLYVLSGNISLGASYVIGSGSGYGCAGCSQSGTIELYNNSTGKMTIQSGTSYSLLLNPNGGNVGIGTATTPSLLTVSKASGTSYVAEFQNTTAATPYTLRIIEPPSATAGYPLLNVHNNAATTEYFRVNSGGNSYFMGGNVGVGATTPTYKLEVVSGTNNPFYLNGTYNKIQANAGFTEIESFHNTRLVIDSTNSYTDRFFSVSKGASYIGGGSPTELFRITEGGNVGIGTAAPATKLDVSGGIIRQSGYSVSDAATDNLLVNGDFEMGGIYGWSGLDSAVSGGYSGNYAAQRTGGNTVLSDDYIPVDPTKDVLQLEGYFKKTVAGTTPGLIYFGYIAYNASKSAITTSPCGTYCYFAASGYTLPADGVWHKLSATTAGEGISYPNFPVGTKYVRVLVLINYSASSDAVTQMDHVSLRRINYGPLFVGNNFNSTNLVDQHQASQLYTTSANNLIISPSASGNVGIGTASPTTKLEVSGTVKATAFEGGSYAGTINAGNVSAGTFGSNTGYGNYTFKESASPNNPILHVDALNGRVGVGTSAPIGRLDVSSTTGSGANTSLNIIGTGTGAQTWSLYPSTSQSLTLLRPGLRLATFLNDGGFAVGGLSDDIGSGADFYVNGTSGNVGIGTIAPGSTLEVKKIISGTSSNTVANFRVENSLDPTSDKVLNINIDNTENFPVISLASSKQGGTTPNLKFGSSIFVADGYPLENGKVGIGTTSPAAGLDVQKAVTASGLVATGTNLQQTLTASANNDVLTALKVNPTFVPGAFTGVTQYAINATGTIKGTSFEGALSGTVNAGNVSAGSFGLNTGGGNYTFPANVGIGMTTTPENWLHIKNTTKDTTTSPNEVGLTLESAVSTNQKYQLGVGVSGISNQYFSLRDITAGAYRMVVNTSGYVGIGTTSPNAILHVATSGGITPIRATNSDYNGTTVGSGFGISLGAATGDTYTKLQAFDAGGASSSDLILQSAGGNVGIGTTSPQAKLDVFQSGAINTTTPGTTRYGLHLTPQNTTVDTAVGITFGAGDSGLGQTAQAGIYSQFGGSYGTKMYFATTDQYSTGAKIRMMIDHFGNLGIGTNSPASALDVRKAITASGLVATGTNLQQTLTASANNDVLTALKVNPTFVPGIYTGTTQYAIDATGTIKGTAFEGALSGTVNSGNVSAGSFGGNTAGGVYGFPDKVSVGYGLNSTPTTISQTGILAVSGNVGIGTVVPTNRLHLAYPGVGNQVGIYFEDPTATAYGGRVYFDDTSNTFRVVTIENGVEVSGGLVISRTSGNVGIGTTAPGQKLEVYSGGNGDGILLRESFVGGSALASIFQNTGDGTGAALKLYDGSGNTKVNIDSGTGNNYFNGGGNVGIGTASPAQKLEISSSSDAYSKVTSTNASGDVYQLFYNSADNADSWAVGRYNGGSFFINRSTTNYPAGTLSTYFAINNAGNVGIGTISPSQKLDVAGGAKMTTLNQGSGTNERFYPNVVSSAQDAQVTGAWIINTPIPRASNQMFRIRVHGYGYGNQDSIDFTIVGYPYSGAVGSVDGLGGAIVNYDLQDNGTDGLEKWVGVNSSGNLAIALGNTTTGAYYYRISVDAWVTRTTTDYSTGWSVAQSIVSGFGFLDIKGPLTSSIKNTIFVNSTGNVGIGQSSPTVKLDVSGEVKATTFTGTYAGTINSGNVSSGTFGSNTGYGNYTFKESGSPNNPILHVDAANGMVGVGTVTPIGKLDIRWPTDWPTAQAVVVNTTSQNPSVRLYRPTGTGSNSSIWYFRAGGTYTDSLEIVPGTSTVVGTDTLLSPAIAIRASGNVGIGQTNPTTNLDILGANASLIKITRSSVANANIQYSNGTYNMYAGLNPAGNFGVSSSADLTSAPFIVTSAGLVGVSQPTPTTTLDVGGVINATTGYRVAGAATSGYFLRGNGTNFVSAQIQASDIPSGAIAAGTLSREDNRQISPSELTAGNLKFGFTAYNNNNASPYADFLHLRSYTDSSGGSDNLLMFNKTDGLGMRLYQQSYGSVTAYATYKDVVLANNTPTANYLTKYSGGATTVSVTNSQIFDNGTNVGIGTAAPAAKFAVTGNMFLGNLEADQGYSLTWRGRNDLGIDEDAYSLVIGAPEGIRINLDSNNNTTGTNFEIAKDVNAKTGGTVLFMVRESDGFVGIAKTNPATALDVNGTVTATSFSGALTGTVSAGNVSSGTFGLNTGYGNFTFAESASPNNPILHVDALNGRVGIGTTSPGSSLQISTSNQFRVYVSEGIILPTYYYLGDIAYNNGILKVSGILGGHQQSQGRADVNLTFSVRDAFTALGNVWGAVGTGSDIVVYNDTVASKYKVYLKTDDYGLVNLNLTAVSGATVGYTGSGSTTAPAYTLAYTLSTDAGGVVRSLTDGNVGIGIIPTADPSGYNLDVGPGGSYTARLGTSSADTVLIGGGAGKLNVGTIDPIYTIGTKRYATYTTAMTGVKEETSGTIRLQKTGSRYMATLNFGSAEEGSDLWLFYQVTDFDSEWDGLSVLLSSGFDGSVWYEKDAAKKVIHIYGAPTVASALSSGEPMEVSYRLTAPRFDHRKWSNYSEDEAEGFKLDVKE